MKRKDLEALELSAEVIEKIMSLHGKTVDKLQGDVDTLKAENDALKTQVTDANKQIEKFGELDIEAVKKEAADWKAKAEQASKDADAKVYEYKFSKRLETKLKDEFKVRNPKRLIADLDISMLKYNEEKDDIEGNLADQLKPIQEAEAYLFETEEKTPPSVSSKASPAKTNKSAFISGFDEGIGLNRKD